MFDYLLFKDISDRIVAIVAFLVLLPLFFIIAFGIKIDSKGSIFYFQNRLGKNGVPFKICKFRSMRTDINFRTTETLATDPRITNFGKLLRKTSLDELPQLINIIKGEMSFIGPRPPLLTYPKNFCEYNEFERKRFNVKPGVSG
jgi:lipopolysaccharide/colanic/teichoic acid biosynthesis glycosyltransferase